MHHCKKFFVALQDLFAATQQISQKPHFYSKNRGLRAQIIGLTGVFLLKNQEKE